jgi:CPA2 family monovalent cation:H+ antiporter-2
MLTHRLGLSPIVGYLVAGVAIGPYTPGFVGDLHIAAQLAEIGVILLMFGVGLHFHFEDLYAVRAVALPGAIVQTLFATVAGAMLFGWFGWPLSAGLVVGVAMAVASTVVLMRVLLDNHQLTTPQGHVAVGWLIVEDIITVVVLVLIPTLALGGDRGGEGWLVPLGIAIVKLAVLVALVVLAGSRIVPKVLVWVARLRSRELFTLSILVLSVAVATASALVFGASVALGAFLAGMVVGQSPVSKQAAADLLPLRDAFAVLFFVSVGMLFDPRFLLENPALTIGGLVIVLLVKPTAAILIVAVLGYPLRTALTVAIGLAQIGEFSFLVSDLARKVGVLPDEGHNLLVAVALVSITINPLLFRSIPGIEAAVRRRPGLWRLLGRGSEIRPLPANGGEALAEESSALPSAIVVGYGPAGRGVDRLLREAGMETMVIDTNIDTVTELHAQGRPAVFGDATQASILEQAGVADASHLILTMPDAAKQGEIFSAAKDLNATLRIVARARYAKDRDSLDEFSDVVAIVDEIETAVALARLVLLETGAEESRIETETRRIRETFGEGGT